MILGDALVWVAVALAAAAGVTAGRSPRSTFLLVASAVACTAAVGRLAVAFATEEWALDYVADHTRSGLGAPIRIAGLWAGAEGSLLLWVAMVAWAAVLAARAPSRSSSDSAPVPGATMTWAIRLGAGLVVGYGGLVALVASPFHRSAVPAVEGLGLQPVLEYPAMIWHPPILYAGLVGMLVPAIRAAAAMLAPNEAVEEVAPDRRRASHRVAGWSSPVALPVAMSVLTIGLATGALWAGVELGWGGYWAWDPIESAGLVAWLFAAAAIHVGRHERRAGGPVSTPLPLPLLGGLLVAPGLAALWATTLTRVGVVASVHAFADRPALRVGLFAVAGVASAMAVLAIGLALRAGGAGPQQDSLGRDDSKRSTRSHRVYAVAVLVAAASFVAIGAYEPVVEAGTTGDAVAIAGRYYTRVLWPLTIVGGALAVRADRRWWWAVGGAAIGGWAVPIAAGLFAVALAAASGAVAASAIGTSIGGRRVRAGIVAHVGVGITLVGIAGTVATTASTITVAAGATERVDGMTVTHHSVALVDGEAISEAVADVTVDGRTFRPRLVAYELRGASSSETATRRSGFDEVQVQLVDGNDRAARYRIIRLPRVQLVWIGAAIVAVGLAVQPLRRLRASSSDSVDGSASSSDVPPTGVDDLVGTGGDGVPAPAVAPDGTVG